MGKGKVVLLLLVMLFMVMSSLVVLSISESVYDELSLILEMSGFLIFVFLLLTSRRG